MVDFFMILRYLCVDKQLELHSFRKDSFCIQIFDISFSVRLTR